ncbi:MAG: MFS transporter [Rhodospirillaceae bacterium]|nr:MAG: MFS transporter [Rhodospirillaceae bacterium]
MASGAFSNSATNHPGTNHALAPRMAAIAFVSYNMALASLYGTYGLLIGPIEAKLGVTRDLSSLGIPLAMLTISMTAPVAGVLAGKVSIRLLMMVGALMMAAGFAVAAAAGTITIFLAAYALLLGPGLCLSATILPSTLVTRWFNVNRGRALGIVNMPILAVGLPPLAALVLRDHGLSTTYYMLATLMVVLLVPLLFVVDYPPSTIDPTGEDVAAEAAADPGMRIGELLRSIRFWTLTLGYATIVSGTTIIASHLVPMVVGWGIDPTKAGTLLAISAAGGMAGSVIFGWVADRIGGALTLTMLAANGAILWAIMLLQPPYAALLVVVALLGLNGSSVATAMGMALSQRFGQASFGRAFGLSNLVSLPFMVLGAPIAGHLYVLTGSYTVAVIGLIGLLLVGALAAAAGRRAQPMPVAA